MISYTSKTDYLAKRNTIVAELNIKELLKDNNSFSEETISTFSASKAWINIGGWQSWNPGMEVEPGKKQLPLKCKIIKPFNEYLKFPGSKIKETRNIVIGHFITYLRWNDFYLCFASAGNINNTLPPVQYVINRKKNLIQIQLCDINKNWKKNELQAEIEIFTAKSYFELKEKLSDIFGSADSDSNKYNPRFDQIQHLGKIAAGWESWYNHYSFINEKLIIEDLNSLKTTKNILNEGNFNNLVFQIDDGWEKGLGNWEIWEERFPSGLKNITDRIKNEGYIPGLWIAPFITDLRSPIIKQHPDWILKNHFDKPIASGFNPLWGAKFGKDQPGFPCSFYCLDLSIPEVISYLDSIIERTIENWGFRYLKLDFLYAGMINGKHKNGGASYQWYTKAVAFLTRRRENSKGEKITYLGCGAPFELSFKDFPLCRIGCDTYEHWENKLSKMLQISGRNSAWLNLTDTIGRAFWDKIVFANDPDVVFIRNDNCSLNKKQKLLIGTVAAIFGSQIMYSDDPAASNSEEELQLTREIVEIFEKYKNEEFSVKALKKNVYKVETKSGKYNGILNLEEGYADIQ